VCGGNKEPPAHRRLFTFAALQCIAAALRQLRVLIRATASSMTLVFIRESGGAALAGVGMQWCDGFVAKPKWEFPRLCRGGSKSLTYPGVDAPGPSPRLEWRAAKHTKGNRIDGWFES
jgi:hypothetical protein